jgi:hypothetical protein
MIDSLYDAGMGQVACEAHSGPQTMSAFLRATSASQHAQVYLSCTEAMLESAVRADDQGTMER